MSARKLSLPGRRPVTAVLALAVLAGALAATGLSARKGDNHVHDRLGHRVHRQPGDERRLGDPGPPGRARLRQQEQPRRPHDQGLLCRRCGDADDGGRRLQPARQPDARPGDRRLRVDAVEGRVRHVPDRRQHALRPGPDLDVGLDLPAELLLARQRRQPAGEPADDYLTKNGTKKIYIVASDFASGHVGSGRSRSGRRPTARRSSGSRTSRSARPTSRATSRRSPPPSPTR